MLISSSILIFFAIVGTVSLGVWMVLAYQFAYGPKQKTVEQTEIKMLREQLELKQEEVATLRAAYTHLEDVHNKQQNMILNNFLQG
jgi:Tfp pilus assembly protein PilO